MRAKIGDVKSYITLLLLVLLIDQPSAGGISEKVVLVTRVDACHSSANLNIAHSKHKEAARQTNISYHRPFPMHCHPEGAVQIREEKSNTS